MVATTGWPRVVWELKTRRGHQEHIRIVELLEETGGKQEQRGHNTPPRKSVAWARLSWGTAPTSPNQASGDAEMVFPHLEIHNFIHSEPSFHCTEMDVAAHVILTSRLSHPYIKQPREPELIHLFATEDGSVSKLFY